MRRARKSSEELKLILTITSPRRVVIELTKIRTIFITKIIISGARPSTL